MPGNDSFYREIGLDHAFAGERSTKDPALAAALSSLQRDMILLENTPPPTPAYLATLKELEKVPTPMSPPSQPETSSSLQQALTGAENEFVFVCSHFPEETIGSAIAPLLPFTEGKVPETQIQECLKTLCVNINAAPVEYPLALTDLARETSPKLPMKLVNFAKDQKWSEEALTGFVLYDCAVDSLAQQIGGFKQPSDDVKTLLYNCVVVKKYSLNETLGVFREYSRTKNIKAINFDQVASASPTATYISGTSSFQAEITAKENLPLVGRFKTFLETALKTPAPPAPTPEPGEISPSQRLESAESQTTLNSDSEITPPGPPNLQNRELATPEVPVQQGQVRIQDRRIVSDYTYADYLDTLGRMHVRSLLEQAFYHYDRAACAQLEVELGLGNKPRQYGLVAERAESLRLAFQCIDRAAKNLSGQDQKGFIVLPKVPSNEKFCFRTYAEFRAKGLDVSQYYRTIILQIRKNQYTKTQSFPRVDPQYAHPVPGTKWLERVGYDFTQGFVEDLQNFRLHDIST